MSKIRKEIQKSIESLEKEKDNQYKAEIVFKEDFTGFKGHFPNNPILPGVCKIQAVLGVYKKIHNSYCNLKKIVNAKFFSPVNPGEKLILNYKETNVDSELSLKSIIKRGDKKVAQIHLQVKEEDTDEEK